MPFHSIADVSAMSPMLVCQSFVSVSGPGVPATSLLTPLRAESCSSTGQSSTVGAVVDVGDAEADGDGFGAVGVGDGEIEADADAVGRGEDEELAVGVAVADGAAVGEGALAGSTAP